MLSPSGLQLQELTTFQQEVASMRKAAADAERRQAEASAGRELNMMYDAYIYIYIYKYIDLPFIYHAH